MRAYEILLEYRRDITAKNYGEKLLTALALHRTVGLPYYLSGYRHLVQLIRQLHTRYPGSSKLHSLVPGSSNSYKVTMKPVNLETPQGYLNITSDNIEQIYDQVKQDIIDHILMALEERDPTQNKEYVQWLARMMIKSYESIGGLDPRGAVTIEDFNRNDMLLAYDVAKRRNLLKPEHRDINKFATYRDFERTINTEYRVDEILNTEEVGRGASKKVYEDETVTVYVPLDARAARSLGCNTIWCTRGEDQYQSYTRSGPLYILLPKVQEISDEITKYQIHLPTAQYMDPDDDPVDPGELMDRYPGFFDWLVKNDADAKDNSQLLNDETISALWRAISQTVIILLKDRAVELGYEDEFYMDELRDAGALDVDGSIDDDVVDRLNMHYWQENADIKDDLKTLTKMAAMSSGDIRYWVGHAASDVDQSLKSIPRLPDVYLHAIEMNELDHINRYKEIMNILLLVYVHTTATRKQDLEAARNRGQRTELVTTVGPYDVGYYDRRPGSFGE